MISKTANGTLMARAREALSGNWGVAIGAALVAMFAGAASSIIPLFGPLLIGGPIALGMAFFALNMARHRKARVEDVFTGFNNFGTAVVAYLVMALLTFAGSLCFIVPGIIVMLMLSQTFFIIADNPSIEPMDALRQSRDMMEGNKGKLFTMYLGFFGLSILCLFTCGIGFLWLTPYMQVSLANFHDDISGKAGVTYQALNSPDPAYDLPDYEKDLVPEREPRKGRHDEG